MKLQSRLPYAGYEPASYNRSYLNTYPTAMGILTDYISLWRRKEATGNTYTIPLADLNKMPGCGEDMADACMAGLMDIGLLSGLKSAEPGAAGMEVSFSYEVIAIIVERSFDFPGEEPAETAEAILRLLLMPANET